MELAKEYKISEALLYEINFKNKFCVLIVRAFDVRVVVSGPCVTCGE